MTPKARRGHRGSSLIEIVVSMTVLAILMGVAAGFAELVLRYERVGRELQARTVATMQLASLFRNDVRNARRVELPAVAEGAALVLDDAAGTVVTYERIRGRLVREKWAGGESRQREAFLVTLDRPVRFERDGTTGGVAVIRLVLDEKPGKVKAPARPTVIEAALGAEHRFERETER
jgi:prepilin-type N-terminal cleavage/methylation domain-containing protein